MSELRTVLPVRKVVRLGPERVVAAGNGDRPRTAMIDGVGGERRDTE